MNKKPKLQQWQKPVRVNSDCWFYISKSGRSIEFVTRTFGCNRIQVRTLVNAICKVEAELSKEEHEPPR